MNIEDYKDLSYLLSCYFHQDFHCDYSGQDEAINDFINNESAEVVQQTAEQIGIILSKDFSEKEIRALLESLGSYYAPWLASDIKAQEWLFALSNTLYKHIYS